MRIADTDIIIVPGLGNSGQNHWQRRWADRFKTASVVEQANWDHPEFEAWISAIEAAVDNATRPVILIAHSLGVSAIAHAAKRFTEGKVRGAFLVAAPDLENPNAPPEAAPFAPVPSHPLPFPSILVASSNDELCSIERSAEFAIGWGSDFHQAGDAGHINTASGHGPWPEGLLMFTRLMQRIRD